MFLLDICKNTITDLMFINNTICICKTVEQEDIPIYTAVGNCSDIIYADYSAHLLINYLNQNTEHLNWNETKIVKINIATDLDNN